jgi:hypothetical protein
MVNATRMNKAKAEGIVQLNCDDFSPAGFCRAALFGPPGGRFHEFTPAFQEGKDGLLSSAYWPESRKR